MVIRLSEMGMRLTRISMRERRPWAWRLYCARRRRARSVTAAALALCVAPRVCSGTWRDRTLELEVIYQGLLLSYREAGPRLLNRASVMRCSGWRAGLDRDCGVVRARGGRWA